MAGKMVVEVDNEKVNRNHLGHYGVGTKETALPSMGGHLHINTDPALSRQMQTIRQDSLDDKSADDEKELGERVTPHVRNWLPYLVT